jgi:hypothetical protein
MGYFGRMSWAALTLGCAAAVFSWRVEAQPEPSFRSTCGDLRESLRKLNSKPDDYFTIEVADTLTGVHSDGALVYMTMCSPPDPQVLCVTYSMGDRKKGEKAIIVGPYSERGPDHIMLDPCLHHSFDGEGVN